MAEIRSKAEKRASNEGKHNHNGCPEHFGFAVQDHGQDQASVENKVSIVSDQVTVTLANLSLIQFGHSGRIIADSKPCCEPSISSQGYKQQQHGLPKPHDAEGGLKNNSVPDDASGVDSTRTNRSILHNSDVRFDGEDQRRPAADTTSSGAQVREIHGIDVEYRLPMIAKQGSLTGKRCENIMKTLEELQDNGRFEVHEDLACNLIEFYRKNKDADMVASLMIERGVAFYYANDLKMSRKLYKTVIRMGGELENRSLLLGRAYVQLATVYRYEFGKAIQYLKQAEELLSHHEPGEDPADLCYYYGLKYLYLYWYSFSKDKGVLRKQAREYLERAIANCARDERSRVQLKKKRYFSLRLAALHLDCGTQSARKTRQITNGDIEAAKKHLDFVEYQLSDGIPLGTEIQLLKARSDQYRREGKFDVAKETAQQALGLAERINMRLEIVPLNERIEECADILAARSPDITDTERFSDSGCSTDGSSSN